ncbi:MAG: tetratricopeptide repeat protein [Deltaproteobacteria bacterium]|nr:tetratricopeptide repeat protein [Deltaproteobacteria bacterium]
MKKIIFLIFIAYLITLSFAAFQRNAIWNNVIGLWGDVVKKSPYKARGHYNLGLAFKGAGRFDEAMLEWKRTIDIDPLHSWAHDNLGNVYLMRGDSYSAILEYSKALYTNPMNAEAHYNMAIALEKIDKHDEAMVHYRKFIKIAPEEYRDLVMQVKNKIGNNN